MPSNYWMHCEFLLIDGGKVSKSLNNFYTIHDLQEKGFSPLDYRMFNFSSHYRNKINFTFEAMEAAKSALKRLKEGYKVHEEGSGSLEPEVITQYEQKFLEAINDDLNMPVAMSVVWEVVKNPNKSKQLAELLKKFDLVLGLKIDEEEAKEELPQEILDLIEERKSARSNKDWAKSDELRDLILAKGYIVKDSKEGMTVEKQ